MGKKIKLRMTRATKLLDFKMTGALIHTLQFIEEPAAQCTVQDRIFTLEPPGRLWNSMDSVIVTFWLSLEVRTSVMEVRALRCWKSKFNTELASHTGK